MLKDKNLLEDCDLVEKLNDKTAQTICGGVKILNELDQVQTVGWIHLINGECGLIRIRPGETQTIKRDGIRLIIDRNPDRGDANYEPFIDPNKYDCDNQMSLVLNINNQVDLVTTYSLP